MFKAEVQIVPRDPSNQVPREDSSTFACGKQNRREEGSRAGAWLRDRVKYVRSVHFDRYIGDTCPRRGVALELSSVHFCRDYPPWSSPPLFLSMLSVPSLLFSRPSSLPLAGAPTTPPPPPADHRRGGHGELQTSLLVGADAGGV